MFFSLLCITIANMFLVRGETLHPILTFSTGKSSGLNLCRSCALCHSLWEFICTSVPYLEDIVSLLPSVTSDSYNCPTSSPTEIAKLLGKGFDVFYDDISFRNKCFNFYQPLHFPVYVSVNYHPISYKEELLSCELREWLIYGYSSMSLGVILSPSIKFIN